MHNNIIKREVYNERVFCEKEIVEISGERSKYAFWLVKLAEDLDMLSCIFEELDVPADFCEMDARSDFCEMDARSDYWADMSNEDQADVIIGILEKETKKL